MHAPRLPPYFELGLLHKARLRRVVVFARASPIQSLEALSRSLQVATRVLHFRDISRQPNASRDNKEVIVQVKLPHLTQALPFQLQALDLALA